MKTPTPRPALNIPADPAVADILQQSEQKQAEAHMSKDEREHMLKYREMKQERKEKAQQKSAGQKPNRTHLLLPVDLKIKLESIANWHHITTSQVATYMLFEAVEQYEQGQLKSKVNDHLVPSESPRYDFNLLHPNDSERREKHLAHQAKKVRGGRK